MQIIHKASTLELEDLPLDIGYASERVSLKSSNNEIHHIGGQNGSTQIIVSAPFIDDSLLSQLKELDDLLNLNALGGITKGLIVATSNHASPQMEGWLFGFDEDEAFGDYYGVRLVGDDLQGEFAKSLFIISKDGALFYNEILSDLSKPFSLDKALSKIVAATSCYTGKGCH